MSSSISYITNLIHGAEHLATNTKHLRHTFDTALHFTLKHEGSLNTDPRDAGNINGSVTNYGITQKSYDNWRMERYGASAKRDVRLITPPEISDLYYDDYFLPVRADEVNPKLAVALFDSSVNLGPRRTIQHLQAAVGVRQDGIFGPKTMRAVKDSKVEITLQKLLSNRDAFYQQLGASEKYSPFLKGWLNRTQALRRFLS